MDARCILCNNILFEEAHVEARRNFSELDDDRIQNIIRLCPTCHWLFDLGYITVHPDHEIFVFSRVNHRKNIFRTLDYAYPHDDSLSAIPKRHIQRNVQEEFQSVYGENEMAIRFGEKPPLKRLYLTYHIIAQ